MSSLGSIYERIRQARNELSGGRARTLLREAADMCEALESTEIHATHIKARIFGDLALEETKPNSRASCWRKCIQTIKKAADSGSEIAPDAAEDFGLLAVDCYQDRFSGITADERVRILRNSLAALDCALKKKTIVLRAFWYERPECCVTYHFPKYLLKLN